MDLLVVNQDNQQIASFSSCYFEDAVVFMQQHADVNPVLCFTMNNTDWLDFVGPHPHNPPPLRPL